jgi:hypothetical protein
MKKFKIKSIAALAALMITSCLYFTSCGEMDEAYKQYVVVGGLTYPGRAIDPTSNAGYYRARIQWKTSNDPKVVRSRIYWNNYTDSTDVELVPNVEEQVKVIEPLDEDTYTFVVINFDADGNASIPTETAVSVYGDKFKTNCFDRTIVTATANNLGVLQGELGNKVRYGIESLVEYVNTAGKTVTLHLGPDDFEFTINDYQSGNLKTVTLFMPGEECIDPIYGTWKEYAVIRK